MSLVRPKERTYPMTGTRTRLSAEFRAKVVLEAIWGELTVSHLVATHGVHRTLIDAWKRLAAISSTNSSSVARSLT